MPLRAATPPSTAPLTRRQIREAERRAEQASVREAAARLAATLSGTHLATVPLPDAGAETVSQETEPAAAAAHRSRAERRTAERAAARRPSRLHAPRWMPRAAVLGALGAATIVAPLAGFVGVGEAPAQEQPVVATVPFGQTVLDSIEAAAGTHDEKTAGSAAALLADSSATARALVQSSRSVERDAPMCVSAAGSGANGAGAALGGERVVMPLVAGTYTQSSLYGNRVHPITGGWSKHEGLDFAAPLGTDIHAVADGTVVHAGEGLDGRSSMLVIIEHEVGGEHFYSWYVHMYPQGVFVEAGQQVRAGEVIGEVGNNGNSTGPHLHLEIHLDENGTTTDPGAFLADREAVMLSADC
ncbi:M23 family metallopeptidase [Georgenia sp. 311]|uniref:M23 family metallopeptidase n=1 Tax=Georgenia wutianyii TaxID=2585135 RepID=A0ABX5VT21_9MICO|nr:MULTISPECIES: M23 family metallopeptidase [Georgenia]QDB80075.1 M23 family metallopeptidase [Georgenia wutianyii]TNC17342.1 M23 family metallopeptidase [Georgenia sp. 311]